MAGPALIPLLLGGAALGSLYDSYGDKIAKTAREIKNRKKDKPKTKDEKEGDEMSDNWIEGAVKKPGALRETAKKEGLIEGDEKLSGTDLKKLAAQAADTGNKKLAQRVNLAKTFAKMRKADGGAVEKEASEVGKEVEESSPIWSRYSEDVPHASKQYAKGGSVIHKPTPVTPQDVLRTKKEGSALGKELEQDADVKGADDDYKSILAALKKLDEEQKPRYEIERT